MVIGKRDNRCRVSLVPLDTAIARRGGTIRSRKAFEPTPVEFCAFVAVAGIGVTCLFLFSCVAPLQGDAIVRGVVCAVSYVFVEEMEGVFVTTRFSTSTKQKKGKSFSVPNGVKRSMIFP